ncbi:MAG: DEAD/DEAH box helicase [Proteobacteria bacterium]|nr:DEAD/DEAH box helicase [Pseudomonadota bacterium]
MNTLNIKTDRLWAAYQSLSPQSRFTLQACALVGEPVREGALASCLFSPVSSQTWPTNTEKKLLAGLADLTEKNLLKNGCACREEILEIVAHDAWKQPYFAALSGAIKQNWPTTPPEENPEPDSLWRRSLRDLRFALLAGDETEYNHTLLRLLALQEEFPDRFPENPLIILCGRPFDPPWFSKLPLHVQLYALHQIFLDGLLHLSEIPLPVAYLQDKNFLKGLPAKNREPFSYLLSSHLLIRGETRAAATWLSGRRQQAPPLGVQGWQLFLAGETDSAIHCYEDDLTKIRKANQNEQAYFTGVEGLFYLMALLKNGDYTTHQHVRKIIQDIEDIQPHSLFLPAYTLLIALMEAKENRLDLARDRLTAVSLLPRPHSITALFLALVTYWIEGKPSPVCLPHLKAFYKKSAAHGYLWLAREYGSLLDLAGEISPPPVIMQEFKDTCSLVSAITPEEQWQRALRALNFSSAPALPPKPETTSRLVWMIDYQKQDDAISLTPKVQNLTARGLWTKGRSVALRKLFRKNKPSFLSPQDLLICETIVEKKDSRGVFFRFTMPQALLALIGHPYVFLADSPKTPVEILQGEPELRVDQQGDSLLIQFSPWPDSNEAIVYRETPARFRIYPITEDHRRVAQVIGSNGLSVPLDGKDELFATLGNISSFMTVHSTIDGKSVGIAESQPDSRIHMQLLPYGAGFRLAMLVKPLQPDGPYQRPGEGPKTIIGHNGGRRAQTKRDLELEEKNARFVEESCPMLTKGSELEREWLLQDPEECLQLLLELQSLPEDVIIEWPEGERLTVSPPAELNQFMLSVKERNNWFEMTGTLKLNESLVLDMRTLLELAQTNSSRFIPLGHGHFLALSRELRKRLDEIAAFAELRKNTVRLHPLAALALEDFTSGVGSLRTDLRWQEQQKRLKEAQEYEPKIPSTFKAVLRDYQLTGFNWLSRLANWGVGACLADDMGLGKTIQALALALDRASQGPTLVVAPTSVCPNWHEEANRFAPTFRVVPFGGRQRKKMLADLGPFDLLICSYGLLQQESALLATRNWETIILDEAQAIKNFITKRSRAAMLLQGRFKMVTTGTPIENHLTELWNLFQFINPGLLGSLNQFNQRFAIPIERGNDPDARKKLKKLISPFILRRLKSQVLEELPERTEILLQVEMEEKEAALYAALRQRALENLRQTGGPPGKRSLQILAEIMKLRRACCNPRLVLPDTDIPSAKLNLFAKLVTELRENGHKALVFSQFVGHLSLVREHLDREGIPYRYLDGSTAPKERQRQVQEFQAGHGDLFLISLKAGGVGLNLTAADYVIHMDPWWNPAVEDQASDRAHRIGQKHPVTIYRLVAKNTIEEKIVHLHHEKRALADSLLEGTNVSHAINPADLLRLLKEN